MFTGQMSLHSTARPRWSVAVPVVSSFFHGLGGRERSCARAAMHTGPAPLCRHSDRHRPIIFQGLRVGMWVTSRAGAWRSGKHGFSAARALREARCPGERRPSARGLLWGWPQATGAFRKASREESSLFGRSGAPGTSLALIVNGLPHAYRGPSCRASARRARIEGALVGNGQRWSVAVPVEPAGVTSLVARYRQNRDVAPPRVSDRTRTNHDLWVTSRALAWRSIRRAVLR